MTALLGKEITAVDLFCGAGGTSTGLYEACNDLGLPLELVAVNHWETAVETHSRNHPDARHFCARIEEVDPASLFCADVRRRGIDLLLASPECKHFSRARGARPISDQKRTPAWRILDWVEALRPREIVIENVPEMRSWGPLDDRERLIRATKGRTFEAFLAALRSLDYTVEHRLLVCADFGDPTTRERLFIRARRGAVAPAWPVPSHSRTGEELPRWRSAAEIIDWTDLGTSIFARRRPLAANTLRRIEAGVRRFCQDEHVEPFLALLKGRSTVRAVDRPLPTITAGARHVALVSPFILPHHQFVASTGAMVDDIARPLRTLTASNADDTYVVSPFVLPYYRTGVPHDVGQPLGTVTTRDRFALVTPDGRAMDIFFRMLSPRECARGQGFRDGYEFAGRTKEDLIRQIGNAVPRRTARALCRAAVGAAIGRAA